MAWKESCCWCSLVVLPGGGRAGKLRSIQPAKYHFEETLRRSILRDGVGPLVLTKVIIEEFRKHAYGDYIGPHESSQELDRLEDTLEV